MGRSISTSLILFSMVALAACTAQPPLPAKAIELNAEGGRALAQGNLAVAEARLAVALEYSPRFVEAWVNLGQVELRRGNFEQARRDLQRAIDLNQDIPAPHHALGLLAESEGRGEDAERHYREALKVDPGFAPARANLARQLFSRRQYENAREQYSRLVAVAPGEIEGWSGEVEALLALGRMSEAHAFLARAKERFGEVGPIVLLEARDNLERGDWRNAEAALASVASGDDRARAASAWGWIAVARLGLGDLDGAVQAAQASLAIDSDEPVARYALRMVGTRGSGALISRPTAEETTP
jgi:tetratricopeptide (TPR) repeat protein